MSKKSQTYEDIVSEMFAKNNTLPKSIRDVQYQRDAIVKYANRLDRELANAANNRQQLEAAQLTNQPVIHTSRHHFQPPLTFSRPQKRDPLLKAARRVLGAESYKTFQGFCNPLFIEPLFSCDVGFILDALQAGGTVVCMYAIGRYGMMAKVPLMLGTVNDEVWVQDRNRFVPLKEWLTTLPAPVCSVTGKAGYASQYNWWKETGQTFQIMDLPAELRIQIMEAAFGYDVYPSTSSFATGDLYLGEGSDQQFGYIDDFSTYNPTLKRVDGPNIAALLVSKTIHSEILDYVRTGTCKCFGSRVSCYSYLLRDSPPPIQFEHLHIVEMHMMNSEYIQFFGIEASPFKDRGLFNYQLWQEAVKLTTLPNLKHLYLRFRSPIYAGVDDPWGSTGAYNHDRIRTDWRGNDPKVGFHTSCQKVLIDWILTYAKEYIEKIPKATLCGYIKNSTKEKWDKILADERNGVHHDVTEAKKAIETWPDDEL